MAIILAALLAGGHASAAEPARGLAGPGGSIPAGRPRARPPSALTGRAEWEKGEVLLARIAVPPAPVRTAEDEMRTFQLAPGYRLELVAAEPLVRAPIFFEHDPDGRLWVVEYTGYMRDLAGTGEGDPICRLVVLEDTDADGRADRSTPFLEGLVMPRSFAFVKGGVLVLEPPRLLFCEDTDGDLRCDRRREVGTMGAAGNPQHTANGLRYGIDNWLHNADWPRRHRWREGRLIEEETIHRGQFGLTFDESGRVFTCYENRALHGDYLPAESLLRNRSLLKVFQRAGGDRSAFGVNVGIGAKAQEIFPIRVTPAVTLGALELRDDGRLRTYTIASGVCCYDGHQFPPDARGNFFVPESGGHLLGRLVLPPGIAPMATRFYPPEQEFLASTDERFRPVNARVGADGALYVADMYHGIIEHVIFMVPWLAQPIRERRLDEGNDCGRIWRIVADDRPIDRSPPRLASATSAGLVELLTHPNGWHRLTAQRLLVERGDAAIVPALREAAPASLHALWTLDGLGALDRATRLAAMASSDEHVRAAAFGLSEGDPALAAHIADPSQRARLQVALSLRDDAALIALLARESDPLFHTAALTGLAGRELDFLRAWLERGGKDRALAALLVKCVIEEAKPERVKALADLCAAGPEWLRALEPQTQPKDTLTPGAPPLTAAQQQLVAAGRETYATLCAACHQPHGAGAVGVAPPLAGSDWVDAPPERLVRVVLHGLYGPIEVNSQRWNLHMPGLAALDTMTDEHIAGVLSYVRRAWGNRAPPIDPALVAAVRKATAGRTLPWRAEELGLQALAGLETHTVRPDADGVLHLPARLATIYGQKLGYRASLDVLAPWHIASDAAGWTSEVPRGGDDEVFVTLAADAASAGDRFRVETEGHHTLGEVLSSGGYESFREVPAGRLTLPAGASCILLRPEGPLREELADVRAVRLVPVK
jgi:mono/diheme cytochrome c family protein/glucose/arabinose dehydrogenase